MTDRPCGHCGLPNRSDGHDACLGVIPGAMNACCGHGNIKFAYIQYRAEDAPDTIGAWYCLCVPGRASVSVRCSRCGDERTFRIAGEAVFSFIRRSAEARRNS